VQSKEGGGSIGVSITGCFGPCISVGVYGTHPFVTTSGLGLGASGNFHFLDKRPCDQSGYSTGFSFVDGVGAGVSASTNPQDGHPDLSNKNESFSVGARGNLTSPVAGGPSYTWLLGC
jgi:hypothetical protein